MQEVADWLARLGMSEYAQRFAENNIDMGVLGELTDADFDRLGLSIGHRRKLLKALAAGAAPAAEFSPSKSAVASAEFPEITARATSWAARDGPGEVLPVSSGLSPAEIMGGRPPRPQVPAAWSSAGLLVADSGKAYVADAQNDPQRPRWRDRLIFVIAVIGLAGLGSAGAFAYRAVFPETAFPSLPFSMKAENGRSKDVPGNSSQSTRASADPGEKFVGRWPEDNQELKTSTYPTPKAPPTGALGSGPVGPDATVPSAPSTVAPALAAATVPLVTSAAPPASSEPKKSHTVFSRAESAGRNETSSAGTQAGGGAKRKLAAALPIAGRPLSLVPDGQTDVAVQFRSRVPGRFAVQVASERSAADAEAAFRTLQTKFPTQLGERQPIVRRSDLGPEGSYYQALIGPFRTTKEAAAVCRTLKAAGGNCLVERN
jgi:SAM (Sterile alpha motif) domain-containing protein/sporulation related protein